MILAIDFINIEHWLRVALLLALFSITQFVNMVGKILDSVYYNSLIYNLGRIQVLIKK